MPDAPPQLLELIERFTLNKDRYLSPTYNEEQLRHEYMAKVPIRPINFSDPADKSRHDRMVQLVTRMLDLHQKLPAAKLPTDQTRLEREIAATDSQIDALVYQLYSLTPDEIRLVEEATA
jgi:hypothetical protein